MARRLECLDGLRGLLALYVLVSHMAAFTALPAWVTAPLAHGGAAVDLFFVLSGMVIVRSLDSFGHDRRRFLLARAVRTMPAFLVVFAVAVAVQPLPTALPWMPWVAPEDPGRAIWSTGWPGHWAVEIGAHLTMTHGLFPEAALPGAWISFLGAAWSLSTEWQFYVLVALLAPVLRGRTGLSRTFLGLAVIALAWTWATPEAWHFSRAFLPNKAQYFALGVASADWTAGAPARLTRRFALVLGVTLVLCLMQGGAGKLAAPLVWTVCLAAQRTLAASKGDATSLALRRLADILRARPLLTLGAASYCIYLVNEPVQKLLGLVLALLSGGNGVLFTAIWVPSAILLPLTLAWLLHRRIEQPALFAGRAMIERRGPPLPSDKTPVQRRAALP